MERSIIKQAHELQNTKALFLRDLERAQSELKAAEDQIGRVKNQGHRTVSTYRDYFSVAGVDELTNPCIGRV